MAVFVLAALAFVLPAGTLAQPQAPPPPANFFTDTAGVVSPDVAARLEARLREFQTASSNQVLVVVADRVPDGYTSMEEYTNRTAEAWRVGDKAGTTAPSSSFSSPTARSGSRWGMALKARCRTRSPRASSMTRSRRVSDPATMGKACSRALKPSSRRRRASISRSERAAAHRRELSSSFSSSSSSCSSAFSFPCCVRSTPSRTREPIRAAGDLVEDRVAAGAHRGGGVAGGPVAGEARGAVAGAEVSRAGVDLLAAAARPGAGNHG